MKYRLHLFTIAIAFIASILPLASQAATSVSATDCFVRTTVDSTHTVRMQTPSCTLVANNPDTEAEIITIHIENIDPDFVTVDNYDAEAGLTKTDTTLEFQITVAAGDSETIVIEPWHEYGDEFYFVALSDNQAKGTIDVNPVFETLISQINVINPVFYTNSGDLVQGSSNTDTMEQMYDAVLEALDESIAPMYPIAGNHDYGPGLNVFEDYFGVDDYSFDFANTHFTGISTAGSDSKGSVDQATFDWLDENLSSDEQEYSIAFFHHPLLRPDWANNSACCYVDTDNRDQLARVIDESAVDMAIVGHSQGYDFRYLTNDDINTITRGFYQLITGGAGGNLAQPDGKYHFTILRVSPDGIEHTVVNKNSFDTAVEYTDNTGSSTTATAEVTNSDTQDMPYVRLKFKLDSDYDSYIVYDQNGNYYDNLYYHTFDDYTVVYLEVDAPANSTMTYTAAPTTQLHSGRVNTIKYTGQVTYDDQPSSNDTALNITAVPGKKSSVISNIDWGGAQDNYRMQWVETPNNKKANTTYTIGDLPANRLFSVSVNDELYERVGTNGNGSLSFVYKKNKAVRNFDVQMLTDRRNETVATVPYSDGNPQVRIFNDSGNNLSNWFALTQVTGAYSITQADLDGDADNEIIVASGEGNGGLLAVYDQDGNELVSKSPYGEDYTGGISVYHADVTGNGKENLITVSLEGVPQMKLYKYTNAGKLKKLHAITPYKNYTGGIDVAVGDITGDSKADIAVTTKEYSGKKVKLYKITQSKRFHKVATKFLPASYSASAVGIGEFGSANRLRLIVLVTDVRGMEDALFVYKLSTKNKLKQQRRTWISEGFSDTVDIHVADVDNSYSDELVLFSSTNSWISLYNITKSGKAKLWLQEYPFGKSYSSGIGVGEIDSNNDWDSELVTSQLSDESRVRVWNYRSKKKELKQLFSWKGYGFGFSGGTQLAN